jgi:F-type H+-transporting ATPase subunit epsilon
VSEQHLIRLLVVTPDDVVIDRKVVSIRLQQPDGWKGVMARHAPYITQLLSGVMMYRIPEEDEPRYLALYGGTLEVQDNMIVVLTAAAEHGEDPAVLARAIEARQAEAEAIELQAHVEFAKARAALLKALTDLPESPEAIR